VIWTLFYPLGFLVKQFSGQLKRAIFTRGCTFRWRVVAVDDGTDADKDVLLWSKGKGGLLTTNFVLN
jgi:hypothetical protein